MGVSPRPASPLYRCSLRRALLRDHALRSSGAATRAGNTSGHYLCGLAHAKKTRLAGTPRARHMSMACTKPHHATRHITGRAHLEVEDKGLATKVDCHAFALGVEAQRGKQVRAQRPVRGSQPGAVLAAAGAAQTRVSSPVGPQHARRTARHAGMTLSGEQL